MNLSNEQMNELLKPVNPERVKKDGKGFSHLEAWDIRRTMNQIFGIGNWSADVTEMILVRESEVLTKKGTPAWNVVYRARCVLRIGDMFGDGASYSEWAAGDATNPSYGDAHDKAIKTAESQAFKRCAMNLGDQFGLSLYNDGSIQATVEETMVQEHADSGRMNELLDQFDMVADFDGLTWVAQKIPTLDLSMADKEILRKAYAAAKAKLGA